MGVVVKAMPQLLYLRERPPLYRGLGGPQVLSGQVRKISPPLGFDPWAIQPVASHYTDCAIPAHPPLIYCHKL